MEIPQEEIGGYNYAMKKRGEPSLLEIFCSLFWSGLRGWFQGLFQVTGGGGDVVVGRSVGGLLA